MQTNTSLRKSVRRWWLFLLAVAGMTILCFGLAGRPSPVQAAGTTLKVPDDYSTIQQAIDAAQPGDTILVYQPTTPYQENLSITKTLSLSGGWNADFTVQTYGITVIDGQGQGRVISITADSPDMVVQIEGFTVTGSDATGRGGVAVLAAEDGRSNAGAVTLDGAALIWAESLAAANPAVLRANLATLAVQGRFPDGEQGYAGAVAHLDWLESRVAAVRPATSEFAAADNTADCGGGIFSSNASLSLAHNLIIENTGSRSGDGYGAGVCILHSPPGGLLLTKNTIDSNVASLTGIGLGGGIYLSDTPGARLDDNQVRQNIGSSVGSDGAGGGLYAENASGMALDANNFHANTAATSPSLEHVPVGGGAYIRSSNGITLTNNSFTRNLAGLYTGGLGGGLYLFSLSDATLRENTLTNNWAAVYQVTLVRGGAIAMGDASDLSLIDNVFVDNIAGLDAVSLATSYGGAIFAATTVNTLYAGNVFIGNVVALNGIGIGGALATDPSKTGPTVGVTLLDNTFSGNGGGHGGAVRLAALGAVVSGNRFTGNNAGREEDPNAGGALLVEGALESTVVSSADVTIDSNRFIDNSVGRRAESSGGALEIRTTENFTVTNNVFAHNHAGLGGGAFLSMGFPTSATAFGSVVNNTFVDNGWRRPHAGQRPDLAPRTSAQRLARSWPAGHQRLQPQRGVGLGQPSEQLLSHGGWRRNLVAADPHAGW